MGINIEALTKCSATVAVLPTIADHNGHDQLSSLGYHYGMPRLGFCQYFVFSCLIRNNRVLGTPDMADHSGYKIHIYVLAIL